MEEQSASDTEPLEVAIGVLALFGICLAKDEAPPKNGASPKNGVANGVSHAVASDFRSAPRRVVTAGNPIDLVQGRRYLAIIQLIGLTEIAFATKEDVAEKFRGMGFLHVVCWDKDPPSFFPQITLGAGKNFWLLGDWGQANRKEPRDPRLKGVWMIV